ncbi:MAG TPA: LysR family transcriptional regulator [Planctomycetaceae bacterium]|nr:LysR family transcriptional regulator [Planctomycetaceae bacterium]
MVSTLPNPHYYKNNRLQQLRGFCAAAQAESISRAADKLFLSQPSVSLQIQALEREFKATLFERRGPKISLTPDGKTLYELAAPLVEEVDRLHDTFAARRGGVTSGRLDIAAGESTTLYLLPRFVQKFAEQYPGIELKLHNVTGRDGLSMVRRDEVDFAVGSMIEPREDVEYQPMFTYEPMLIVGLNHPLAKRRRVTLKEVAAYPLILPPRHLTTWGVVDYAFGRHNLSYRVKLEAGGWEVIKKYVALGMGISIVTSICLTGDENLAVLPLSRYFPKRTYGLVIRKGKFLSPAAQRFVALMQQAAPRHLPEAEAHQPVKRRRNSASVRPHRAHRR